MNASSSEYRSRTVPDGDISQTICYRPSRSAPWTRTPAGPVLIASLCSTSGLWRTKFLFIVRTPFKYPHRVQAPYRVGITCRPRPVHYTYDNLLLELLMNLEPDSHFCCNPQC